MNDTIPALEQYMEPAPVRFTPDAPGWYALGVLILLLALVILYFVYRNYRKNRYRRDAIRWMNREEKRSRQSDDDRKQYIYSLNMLIKQMCIRLYGRERIAPLSGMEWLAALSGHCPTVRFTEADNLLLRSVYDPRSEFDPRQADAFENKMRSWIKKHRK